MMKAEQETNNLKLKRDLIFLILQFLNEEKYTESLHKLERESGCFFNMNYFEELIMDGNWDEMERYLSGFTNLDDNDYSRKIFFELRKYKYLEALDRRDHVAATTILVNELKVFSAFNQEVFDDLTKLLTLDDFRENKQLASYINATDARSKMLVWFRDLIKANVVFHDRLNFPNLADSRLQNLINQRNPSTNPEMKTLFVDHKCSQPSSSNVRSTTSNPTNRSTSQLGGFLSVASNVVCDQPSQPMVPDQSPYSMWMHGQPTVNHPTVSEGTMAPPMNPVSTQWSLKGHDGITNTMPSGSSDKMKQMVRNLDGRASPVLSKTDELPMTVIRTLNQGSRVVTMDFHPILPTLLLAGTDVGDIGLWEVGSREKLVSLSFRIWNVVSISTLLKLDLGIDSCVAVNCIKWSPTGSLFGVAYSKHMLHVYSYHGENNIQPHLEIEAHIGSVNDIAFASTNEQLSIVTGSDDKTIKVWDVATGANLFTFEGHEAPVFCVCPHVRENFHFIFSTSTDGKIKAWLYDMSGPLVHYDAPGGVGSTTILYSTDGKRLFSCGTNQNGETHLVEWVEKRSIEQINYKGLQKRSLGIVQFDTTKDRFLAAGDDYVIKFWEMDSEDLLATSDAGGDLPETPCICFNKEGTLLAVSARNKRIKILGTLNGIQSLQAYEMPVSIIATKNRDQRSSEDVPKTIEVVKPTKTSKIKEISEPAQLQSLLLPGCVKMAKLTYMSSSDAILALASNAIHLLWRWPHKAKATTKNPPQLWHPISGTLMTNDLTDVRTKEAKPSFALSKNDSYIISTSGGQVSLFSIATFKTMAIFIHPLPVPTYVAFYPHDNNIIAIGMDDSTVLIYDTRANEVKSMLKGHSKPITGLAFSSLSNLLVSAGADNQIIVWQCNKWISKKSSFLQLPTGRLTKKLSGIEVQFHQDQKHFLVVHELKLAVYETIKLECVVQWPVPEMSAPISHATFSCNSQLVYAAFLDGTVCIFCALDLRPRCLINPAAYLPSSTSHVIYPLVVATNPNEPNQFALGLTDGTVRVCEPLESDGEWGEKSQCNDSTTLPAIGSSSKSSPACN